YGRDLCLGMTHEEVVAWLAAREIRSYRDLPQIWYQIQTKERDEARPRSGVLRTREVLMKDAYTLDPDVAALDRSYAAHERASRSSPFSISGRAPGPCSCWSAATTRSTNGSSPAPSAKRSARRTPTRSASTWARRQGRSARSAAGCRCSPTSISRAASTSSA